MQGHTAIISKLLPAGLAAAYAATMVALAPDAPLTQPDSGSYLEFASYRSATYPLFIRLVSPEHLAIAQPLLFAAALAILGFETLAFTRSVVVAAAIMLAIAANPELNAYHGLVMTESLFMSAVVVFLAMVIRFVRRKDLGSLALAAALAGLAATIRPPGFALLPIPIVMAVACRKQLKLPVLPLIAVAVLPAAALVAGELALSRFVHAGQEMSLAPRHIYAKAVMIGAPGASTTESDPLRRALLAAIEDDFAPIRRLIAQAPDRNTRLLLTVIYETCLEYTCSDELRARNNSRQFEAVMLETGLRQLAHAPLAYAGLVWAHYQALWTPYSRTHPATGPPIAAFIRSHRPLPFEPHVSLLIEDVPTSRIATIARPAIMAIGAITGAILLLGMIGACTGRLNDAAAVAWLSALAIHASLLLTAALGVGISRYTLAMWPAMVTSLAFAAWALAVRLGLAAGSALEADRRLV